MHGTSRAHSCSIANSETDYPIIPLSSIILSLCVTACQNASHQLSLHSRFPAHDANILILTTARNSDQRICDARRRKREDRRDRQRDETHFDHRKQPSPFFPHAPGTASSDRQIRQPPLLTQSSDTVNDAHFRISSLIDR